MNPFDNKLSGQDYEAMDSGKEIYEGIQIPQELKQVVNSAIHSVDKKSLLKKSRHQTMIRCFKIAGSFAASLLILTTIGLNTNQAFAEALSDIPVVGALSKVLTVRSYTEQDANTQLTVKAPEITQNEEAQFAVQGTHDSQPAEADIASGTLPATERQKENQEFLADINVEIAQVIDNYIAKSKAEIEEYKQAYLETGGTEEEWNARPIDINVTYEVKYQNGPYLSLVLYNSESWASYTEERVYYNLDLQNNRELTLKDLLGEDYIAIANAAITRQIEENVANDEGIYWGFNDGDASMEGFTTITADTKFYMNAEGKPVVVFPRYEIAPGYMGVPEFVIE